MLSDSDPASQPESSGSALKRSSRPAREWFAPAVAEAVAAEIAAAGGCEIFIVGRLSSSGIISEAEVVARGSREAVPVVARAVQPGEMVLHNHPSGTLDASGPDLEIAAEMGRDGIGFAIIDNACRNIYVVVEPGDREEERPLELGEVEEFFSPGGALSRILPGYEPREVQVHMALSAAGAFNEGRVVMVEAGTGVGKSLAYLLPAILWARRNHRRVVVSTNTINLQEQLLGSDLPVLEQAGLEFSAILVKGRRNYVCLRKVDEVRIEPDLFAELDGDEAELRRLVEWAGESADGSLSDLRPPPPDRVWDKVATESDDCARARCPWFNECRFYRARRRAATADLLIVNHHLLFTDLALRQAIGGESGTAVLPAYSHVIIDEAQHVEETATAHFGTEISSVGLQRQIGRLQHRSRPNRGLLPLLLRALVPLAEKDPQAARALDRLETVVRPACRQAAEETAAHFGSLDRALKPLLGPLGAENRLRLTAETETDPAWAEDARPTCTALRRELAGLVEALERLLRDLDPLRDEYGETLDSPRIDIAASAGRLARASAALARFTDDEEGETETVRWIESSRARQGNPRVVLATAPVEVGPQLARACFEAVEGALLCSATLAVDEDFSYTTARLGLDRLAPGRLVTALLPSPFSYHEQALFLVADDLPLPDADEHMAAAADLLAEAVAAAGGRTLILTTSWGSLRRLHERLAEPLAAAGITLRRQGQAPRADLLAALRSGAGEALLATDSFWEGIDVRGEALSLVAVTRLPFRVPSEPVLQARAEQLERDGGNAFRELLLPMAVLKFKQGMGRLIRHRDDRGIALVLDPRISHRSYGETFITSLGWGAPERIVATQALERIRAWFAAGERS